ncbi:hypothetical protein ECT92401_2454 [Escherichia coli T924_01]|nr:putative prophage protein [Escherichia coli VR50]EFI85856.1 hypothetical protein HMPREF9551_05198 [Escherichia coli MS 196-1]ERC87160.1 hypothetical protein ECT92401_2454 [Escherichia coli T924_01]
MLIYLPKKLALVIPQHYLSVNVFSKRVNQQVFNNIILPAVLE